MDILTREVMRGPGSWISYNQGGHERAWSWKSWIGRSGEGLVHGYAITREVMRGPGSWLPWLERPGKGLGHGKPD